MQAQTHAPAACNDGHTSGAAGPPAEMGGERGRMGGEAL